MIGPWVRHEQQRLQSNTGKMPVLRSRVARRQSQRAAMTNQIHSRVTFCPGLADDTPAILALENSCFDDEHERFNSRQVRRLIASAGAVVMVARAGGRIVGWAAGLARRHATCSSGRIYALAVDGESRGMQIGRRLMEQIIGRLRSRGAGRLYLEVRSDNHAAIALYRKLGFVDFRFLPDYYRPGLHALRMLLK